jgi:hypothetical protein
MSIGYYWHLHVAIFSWDQQHRVHQLLDLLLGSLLPASSTGIEYRHKLMDRQRRVSPCISPMYFPHGLAPWIRPLPCVNRLGMTPVGLFSRVSSTGYQQLIGTSSSCNLIHRSSTCTSSNLIEPHALCSSTL